MAVDGQRFMTKTQHYRKVTKPLLERKRRARMNLYLDELKDLIVDTMEAQGDHVNKLEKADILELTVDYLKSRKHEIAASAQLSAGVPNTVNVEKFRAGYTQAAFEVSKVFASVPGLDLKFGARLMKHLGYQLKDLKQTPVNMKSSNDSDVEFAKPTGCSTPNSRHEASSPSMEIIDVEPKGEDVWRPW